MIQFPVDIVLQDTEICNLEEQLEFLFKSYLEGGHTVLYGRRNTGKTSLVSGKLFPRIQKLHPDCVVVNVDFLSVSNEQDLTTRLRRGLERGLAKAFPNKTILQNVLKTLKYSRPRFTLDSLTGDLSLSLDSSHLKDKESIQDVFEELLALTSKNKLLLVLDEFQDVANLKQGPALIRTGLQSLAIGTPVVILGSKKHILSQIFARHRAPLAGWGTDVEIPPIESEHYRNAYLEYCNQRFSQVGVTLKRHELDTLLAYVQGIPESANIVCDFILRHLTSRVLTEEDIKSALAGVIIERRGRFEEAYGRFRHNERIVMVALAKNQPVSQPKSQKFLHQIGSLAPTSVYHAIKQLEKSAEIYKDGDGYRISEPLFGLFLLRCK